MKQTISTINPPPPQKKKKKKRKKTTTTHAKEKKTPQTLNGFQRGSQAGPQPTPPPTPAFLSSSFAMQHLKHLNGTSLANRWLPDNVCWLGYGMPMSCTVI